MNERKDEHFFNISEISTNIKELKISKGPKKFNKILETPVKKWNCTKIRASQ